MGKLRYEIFLMYYWRKGGRCNCLGLWGKVGRLWIIFLGRKGILMFSFNRTASILVLGLGLSLGASAMEHPFNFVEHGKSVNKFIKSVVREYDEDYAYLAVAAQELDAMAALIHCAMDIKILKKTPSNLAQNDEEKIVVMADPENHLAGLIGIKALCLDLSKQQILAACASGKGFFKGMTTKFVPVVLKEGDDTNFVGVLYGIRKVVLHEVAVLTTLMRTSIERIKSNNDRVATDLNETLRVVVANLTAKHKDICSIEGKFLSKVANINSDLEKMAQYTKDIEEQSEPCKAW